MTECPFTWDAKKNSLPLILAGMEHHVHRCSRDFDDVQHVHMCLCGGLRVYPTVAQIDDLERLRLRTELREAQADE